MAAEPIITVEPGADPLTPAAQAVLAGLAAFNQEAMPATGRLGVFARDMATDAPLAGLVLSLYGDRAFTWWGTWTRPEAPAATEAAVLGMAQRMLLGGGLKQMVITARAHAPVTALEQAGFERTQSVPDHLKGGALGFYRRDLEGHWPVLQIPDGISLQIALPPTRPQSAESFACTTWWRQQLTGEPYRWLSAFVREGDTVKGGALCYALGDEFMVDMVWLDAGLRGTGLGARMVCAALDAAPAMGCRRATVETADYQAPRFYRRLGFQDLAYVPDLFSGQGTTVLRMPLPAL